MSIVRTRSYEAFVGIIKLQLEARKQKPATDKEMLIMDKWFQKQSATKAAHMYAVDEILKSRILK